MNEREVVVTTQHGQMPSFAVSPDGEGPWPGIIFYMDARGMREELRNMARRIAKAGYFVLLPDVYYRLGTIQFEFDPPVDQGAVILNVVDSGPADRAGVQVGDVVVTFDGQPVADSEGLGELIRSHRPGDEVRVGVVRADGSQEELTVRLGVNPVPTG